MEQPLGTLGEKVTALVLLAQSSRFGTIFSDLAGWISARRWFIVGTIVVTPAIAILQGTYFVARYRIQYGEAPIPLLPAHGVVVVDEADTGALGLPSPTTSTEDTRTSSESNYDEHRSTGRSTLEEVHVLNEGKVPPLFPLRLSKAQRQIEIKYRNGRTSSAASSSPALSTVPAKRIWGSMSSSCEENAVSKEKIRQAQNAPALRLLVIGDSLAAGVGVLSSCTPLLPEVIAKSLSKALGGRPVYWTCVAEPGASSGWIVKELDKFQNDETSSQRTAAFPEYVSAQALPLSLSHGGRQNSDFILSSDGQVSGSCDDPPNSDACDKTYATFLNVHDKERSDDMDAVLMEWCDRLGVHSKRLKSEVFGEYDVAIVMTGLNDLKGAILPFLLQGDEIEFRRQARLRGGDYTAELKRVVDAVSAKMKHGLKSIRRKMNKDIVERDEVQPLLLDADKGEIYESMDDSNAQNPLVVLTALPSNLPVLQWPPFIWFLVPLIRWADRIKRKLADKYPHTILFVGAPKPASMKEYENRRGQHMEELINENVLLSLKLASAEDCIRKEEDMQSYFIKHVKLKKVSDCPKKERNFGNLFDASNGAIYPANVRPSAPGASLLSADGIHPNDAGVSIFYGSVDYPGFKSD